MYASLFEVKSKSPNEMCINKRKNKWKLIVIMIKFIPTGLGVTTAWVYWAAARG